MPPQFIGVRALLNRLRRLQGDLQDAAGAPLVDASSRVNARVPVAVRTLIYELRHACGDAQELVHLVVAGYSLEKKTNRKRKGKRGERVAKDSHRLLSAAIRIFLSTIVSDLESFTVQYAGLRVTPTVVQAFRTHPLAKELGLPKDEAKALAKLIKWLKPSASSEVTWAERLDVVLGIKLLAGEAEALQTVLTARNFFTHPHRRPPRIDWTDPDFAEVMITSFLAVNTFTLRVAERELR